ncbi:MAG TPA: hypothetical protein PLY97_07060, partial [Acidocella sp.]|nr:hypothetical protein [Acidocella sp.]
MIVDPFKYAAHREGRTAASNKIAVILAANTPFYPLYLYHVQLLADRLLPEYLGNGGLRSPVVAGNQLLDIQAGFR